VPRVTRRPARRAAQPSVSSESSESRRWCRAAPPTGHAVKGAQRTAEDEGASLHLHRWNSRAVVAVALIALASGFGQFGSCGTGRRCPGVRSCRTRALPGGSSRPLGQRARIGLAVIRLASSEACPSSGSPTGSGGARCCSARLARALAHRGIGGQPRVLVVRGDLRLWTPMLSATNALSQVSAAEQRIRVTARRPLP